MSCNLNHHLECLKFFFDVIIILFKMFKIDEASKFSEV